MCLFFCSNSIIWPLPLGSLWISPKLKAYFSLFLFYLFQTNLLTSHRPSLLMVSPLWFFSARLRWPWCFWGVGWWWCLWIMTSHRHFCLWSGQRSVCRARLACSAFCFCAVGMAGTWPGLLGALMWEGSFDDLILICTTQLVGLMFNTCYRSSIQVFLIGSNRIKTPSVPECSTLL